MKIFLRGLIIAGLCAGLTFAAVGTTSVPTSNGTTPSTNPSSVGSFNTPPEQLGGGVGSGNVSKSNPRPNSINQDYQGAVRVYGANSDQAKAALARQNAAVSESRATITNNGQTFPTNGTFTPTVDSGSGAAGTSDVNSGTGMTTGTGTGRAASTNGSPVAH
jgi:hypothetical protein